MKKLLENINEKWYYIFADLFNKTTIYILMLSFSYMVIPEDYGLLSLFNSLVTIFFVFVSLNMTSSYITKKKLESNVDFKKILSSIITFIYIINVFFIIGAILIYLLNITIYSIPAMLFMCSIFTAVLNCNYELLNTVLVAEKNKIRYLVYSLIFSISLLSLSFLLVILCPSLSVYAIIITKIGILLVFSIISINFLKKRYGLEFKIDKEILKEALKFSLPLTLHSLSGFVLNYIDKFMLNDMENLVSTAKYSFSHNLASVMMVISISINKSFLPKFYKLKEKENNIKINEIISKDLKLLTFLFICYITAVGFVFPIFPDSYQNSLLIYILLTYNYLIFYW